MRVRIFGRRAYKKGANLLLLKMFDYWVEMLEQTSPPNQLNQHETLINQLKPLCGSTNGT